MTKLSSILFIGLVVLVSEPGLAATSEVPAPTPYKLQRREFIGETKVTNPKVKVAFFDADSTLRVSKSGLPWATTENDFVVLPNVATRIRELNQSGFLVAIVSNQGRIPGSLTLTEADKAFVQLAQTLKAQDASVNYFDFADKVDHNRKPNLGMFNTLELKLKSQFGPDFEIDRTESMMVGDAAYTANEFWENGERGSDFSNADRRFAENAKIKFVYASDFFRWRGLDMQKISNRFQAFKLQRRLDACRSI